MGCYRCDNLDVKEKKAGRVSGNLYYCKKLKTYVNPAKFKCENFVKNDKRLENGDIYKDGKNYYDNTTPNWFYFFILIILIIVGLIMGVFW